MKTFELVNEDRKAPKLLDLVLLAGEKQAMKLLPLEADDEAGHQGGEESHQDAQRQVPTVCLEETQPLTRFDGGSPDLKPQGVTNSAPLWYPCSSAVALPSLQ